MTYRLFSIGLIASALALTCSPTVAQTVGNGPYYATPSWDQKMPCTSPANCPRFVVLADWNQQAVLDRETGLVWERSPRQNDVTYEQAAQFCALTRIGDRFGWRLPSVHELQSLLVSKPVPAFTSSLFLPDGHPFIGISAGRQYWTGTRRALDSSEVFWTVAMGTAGSPFDSTGPGIGTGFSRDELLRMWCVRGGGPITFY